MKFDPEMLLAPPSTLLGIRAGMNVRVLGAPDGFVEALVLPAGAGLVTSSPTGIDVAVFFTQRKTELVERLPEFARGMAAKGAVWVCFPKDPAPTAPGEDFVRLAALEIGLMDDKHLYLDSFWRALRLVWKPKGPRPEIPQARA